MNNTLNKSKAIIAYVSFPLGDHAKKIAKQLVNDKLVACAKIITNIESFYMWEGKLQEDNKVYLVMKTLESRVDEIKKVLDENHPYKVYEFLYYDVKVGNQKYLEWLEESVSKPDL